MNKQLKILLISSLSPYKSANLGMDVIQALEKAGHQVDFLTKYKFEGMQSNMSSVFDLSEPPPKISWRYKLKLKYPALKYFNPCYFFRKTNKYFIVNQSEDIPPVETELILNKIQGHYDLVITLFWQYMLTTASLKSIYTLLRCPIFIYAVDMFPITGGCYYFWNCRRFLTTCGKCPAFYSSEEKDKTFRNLQIKKDNYSAIEYLFLGNTWMCNWAIKSPLFKPSCIKKIWMVINENIFLNRDKNEARNLLALPSDKKFILFAGAANVLDFRKGFDLLVQAIKQFTSSLSIEEKQQMLLLTAGRNNHRIQKLFDIDVLNLGYLDLHRLTLAYSASDVFLSPSVEDAGPTMINQALMCGIPVVAFEIGVALDEVITGISGYRAPHISVQDFCQGIEYIYRLPEEEKNKMARQCRQIALKFNSFSAFSQSIEKIYKQYRADKAKSS